MKKLFYCLVIFFVSSCSSDDETNDIPEETTGAIKTIKKFAGGSILEEEINYEYTSDGTISRLIKKSILNEIITNFNYDSTGKLISFKEVKTDTFDDVRTEVNHLEYDGDLIVRICQNISFESSSNSGDPEVDKIVFTYNEIGHVSLFEHYYDEDAEQYDCDGVYSVSNTENLEYDANGNMIRYENSDYFFSPVYYEYLYDDSPHVSLNVKPESFRKLFGFSTVNNIISGKEYNVDTGVLEGTISYNYTYNSSDFPITLEKNYSDVDGFFSQTTRYEYTYY